ncbi:endonuclease/exonuclease/phosphatase family protein, partial [Pectobacterium odoriferum]|uniref:endonuclease/exonuclease/phosphatase family protein n=1 Tax=Pectobacterium odoriferum TaxID=78398 RepID=UPI001CF27621
TILTLRAVYALQNGQRLMVINIHAVNFSFGVEVYTKQLATIGEQLVHHQGPAIMAGDFNAWSQQRINALNRFAARMGLQEVHFVDDHRRKAFGRPLDFVFYRELTVNQSSVLVTQASDHNPLLVEFSVS